MFGPAGTSLAFSRVRNSMYDRNCGAYLHLAAGSGDSQCAGSGILEEALTVGRGDTDMVAIARFFRQMGCDGYLVVELQHTRETPRERSLATNLSTSRF
jgi:hypothetical protein